MNQDDEIESLEEEVEVLPEETLDDNIQTVNQDIQVINEVPDYGVYETNNFERTQQHLNNRQTAPGNGSNYFSYEKRFWLLVGAAILFVALTAIFVYLATAAHEKRYVNYTSKGDVSYQACLESNDYYSDQCLGEDSEYIAVLTNKIKTSFSYTEVYSRDVDYKYNYYVMANIKVYNQGSPEKVLYHDEKLLSNREVIEGNGKVSLVIADVEVPFEEYREFVVEYISKYSLAAEADVDVNLYIENDKGVQAVASINVPLMSQTFGIRKSVTDDGGMLSNSVINGYKIQFIFYMILAFITIILAIASLGVLIVLLFKSTRAADPYKKELERILREYDCVIAEAHETGARESNKRVFKVKSFLELLDIRDTLEKPILYEKINSVKSRFFVEDAESIYVFTLKEADFINKK